LQNVFHEVEGAAQKGSNTTGASDLGARLIRILRKLNRTEAVARKQLNGILRDYPNSADALMQVGALSIREKRQRGRSSFRRAYDANPANAGALRSLLALMVNSGNSRKPTSSPKRKLRKGRKRQSCAVCLLIFFSRWEPECGCRVLALCKN